MAGNRVAVIATCTHSALRGRLSLQSPVVRWQQVDRPVSVAEPTVQSVAIEVSRVRIPFHSHNGMQTRPIQKTTFWTATEDLVAGWFVNIA